jgi:hypothetical protein
VVGAQQKIKMKVKFLERGRFEFVAEDGRDSAWLKELANNMSESFRRVLSNFFVFSDSEKDILDEEDEICVEEATEISDLKKVIFYPEGIMLSWYALEAVIETYKTLKSRLKEAVIKFSKQEDLAKWEKDLIEWWNETFPNESVSKLENGKGN